MRRYIRALGKEALETGDLEHIAKRVNTPIENIIDWRYLAEGTAPVISRENDMDEVGQSVRWGVDRLMSAECLKDEVIDEVSVIATFRLAAVLRAAADWLRPGTFYQKEIKDEAELLAQLRHIRDDRKNRMQVGNSCICEDTGHRRLSQRERLCPVHASLDPVTWEDAIYEAEELVRHQNYPVSTEVFMELSLQMRQMAEHYLKHLNARADFLQAQSKATGKWWA